MEADRARMDVLWINNEHTLVYEKRARNTCLVGANFFVLVKLAAASLLDS
jgi:hypothetical protein